MIAVAGLVAMAIAAIATTYGARRESAQRPAAVLLVGGLAAELVRELLGAHVLRPERARLLELADGIDAMREPFSGAVRVAFHVDQALFLAWPTGVATLAWWALRRRDGFTAMVQHGLFLVACVTLLAFGYPAVRGPVLADAYRWFEVVCIASAMSTIAVRTERFGRVQGVALLLVAGQCAVLAGPYLGDPFGLWWLAQASWCVPFAVITALQGRSTWATSHAC